MFWYVDSFTTMFIVYESMSNIFLDISNNQFQALEHMTVAHKNVQHLTGG